MLLHVSIIYVKFDANKCVQAWGVVHNRTTIHGKPLQQDHVIIEVTNVLPTCQLKPPCPGVFGDQEEIRKGNPKRRVSFLATDFCCFASC
jgi:hypothetical protein